ncbi:WD repeat-containing protein 90, partial [Eschrichtius robustus]|nr:WD repeat-containing protein 90 [Eschrichtius robustus]
MRRRRGRVGVETRPEPSPRAALAVTAGELADPATAPSLDSRWVWHLTPLCPPVWQQPFLNVFRHFKVDEWKRSSKEGDVAVVTDKTLKCTVYRVRGPVSAGNYIQLPKTSTQSLGLTGRYLYVLFRPLPAKHFVIHLDLCTEDSQVIRVSFSNFFKEFKSTATWLQFPFICETGTPRKGVGSPGARWTCLQLDLHDILLVYLNRRYSQLKSIRLCASLLVRNLYTSDLCFDPEVSVSCERSEVCSVGGPSGRSQEPLAWVKATDKHVVSDSLHVSARQTTVEPTAPEDASPKESPGRKQNQQEAALGKDRFQQRSFLPDPVLRLKGVIGFGGHSTKWKQAFSSGPGIAISSLSVSQAKCAVGSEDGYLRLWPLDFSSVLLEAGLGGHRPTLPAEHEGPISSVRVSPDGLRVLSTTSSGHLGFLDILSREYSVLVRSHAAPVLALATECSRGQLATVSQDHTVRIWDLATLQQLYDFASPEEAPCAVAFHPTQPTFFCGFSSGAVRSFSLEATEVLVEHRCHRGAITGLAASPDGSLLFSSCSRGSLAQYHSGAPRCRILRVAANVVCQEACPNPSALVVSGDSRLLAFVGPSKYTVTVMDTTSLDELLRVDISTLDLAGSRLDSAVAVCFGPAPPGHLLVSTSSNMVAVLDATSGRLVRELSCVPPAACSVLALSGDGRFLLTAADRAIKVWNYSAQAGPGCQVYIGHSEPVQAVAFTPDQQQLLSVGDAIFLWDVLAPSEKSPPGSVQGSPGAPPTCEA